MAGNFRIEAYSALYNDMNRSGSKGNKYSDSFSSGVLMSQSSVTSKSEMFAGISESIKDDTMQREQENFRRIQEQLRQMKREQLQQANQNMLTPSSSIEDFLMLSGSPESEEDEEDNLKVSKYSYKDVANKILRAKNSVSAGRAVLSAKRKVLEVKRMIGRGEGDPEELQLALTHAKRMEMAARKKKHHLELEEYVENTRKRDERLEKEDDQAQELSSMMTQAAEEEIIEQEDAIFEARQDMISEVMDSIEESGLEASDEAIASINEMISEFGEEELEMLEEAMQMLEEMEIVDPHMSKEDLDELKQKHRASENKAIAKANMDYLKGMFKLYQERKGSAPSMGFGSTKTPVAVSLASSAPAAVAPLVSAEAGMGGGSVDISI